MLTEDALDYCREARAEADPAGLEAWTDAEGTHYRAVPRDMDDCEDCPEAGTPATWELQIDGAEDFWVTVALCGECLERRRAR